MKAITLTTAIAIILMTATSLNAENNENSAQNEIKLTEEAYVNDVPFDTEKIVSGLDEDKTDKKDNEVKLQEEEYVNDVSVDTRKVIVNYFQSLWKDTKDFTEKFTNKVRSYNEKGIITNNQIDVAKLYEIIIQPDEADVELKEEPYVDDVPFDTEDVVNTK
ncbi:MAG: hypothetical protein K9I29_07880 [Bacteroidales bacterium]|nr:hypothetical protein [Bacteroidales bacterium]MCF8328202.1 hypothetical protein [Bacteroidales bacterium]